MKKITYKNTHNPERPYTFFHLSDGKNIIYCEAKEHDPGYYKITSVHMPNEKIGAGYILDEHTELSKQVVENCLPITMPNWADRGDTQYVKKYADLDDFLKRKSEVWAEYEVTEIDL